MLDRIQNQSQLARILKLLGQEDSLIITQALKDDSRYDVQLFKKNEVDSVLSDYASGLWCQFYTEPGKVDQSEQVNLVNPEKYISN